MLPILFEHFRGIKANLSNALPPLMINTSHSPVRKYTKASAAPVFLSSISHRQRNDEIIFSIIILLYWKKIFEVALFKESYLKQTCSLKSDPSVALKKEFFCGQEQLWGYKSTYYIL